MTFYVNDVPTEAMELIETVGESRLKKMVDDAYAECVGDVERQSIYRIGMITIEI